MTIVTKIGVGALASSVALSLGTLIYELARSAIKSGMEGPAIILGVNMGLIAVAAACLIYSMWQHDFGAKRE